MAIVEDMKENVNIQLKCNNVKSRIEKWKFSLFLKDRNIVWKCRILESKKNEYKAFGLIWKANNLKTIYTWLGPPN